MKFDTQISRLLNLQFFLNINSAVVLSSKTKPPCRVVNLSCSLQPFKYTTAETLQSLPFSAILDSYSGGGYVYKIQGSAGNIRNDLEDLKRLYWIDNNTRAVFLEFSTYNANVSQLSQEFRQAHC